MDILVTQSRQIENIFETEVRHIAMAEEPEQPEQRRFRTGMVTSAKDMHWLRLVQQHCGTSPPVNSQGFPKVYNSGVVLYTQTGLKAARDKFFSIDRYAALMHLAKLPKFYRLDQNFLGAASFIPGMFFDELPQHWNVRLRDDSYLPEANDRRIIDSHMKDEPSFYHLQVRNKNKLTESACQYIIRKFEETQYGH